MSQGKATLAESSNNQGETSPPSTPLPKGMRALWQRWSQGDNRGTALLMIISIITGLGTGLVAVLFIRAIAFINHFSFVQGLPQLLAGLGRGWIVVVPVLGALIGGPIIAYWAIEARGHGVPEVMQAVITRGGRIRPRVAAVKSIASAICIGTGGSAGREGPVVQVGAALGSTAAQLLRLGPERTVTLVACGAAAGIAATFNAPIAGVIFAMEVILGEFTTHYFGAVVVSAVAASIVSRQFLGDVPAFVIPSYTLVSAWEVPLYALLGVLAALVAWLFVEFLYFLEHRFDNWRFPTAFKPAVGAVLLGVTALFLPQVLGSGLASIQQSLTNTLPWALMLLLIFAKLAATCFTLGSGNSGGVFSPALYMGAMLGGFFGHWVHIFFPASTAVSGAYALVGMASVFAAAAHAPLTAFLIVFEMSNDYRMILPLMITVGLSTVLSQAIRRNSIYTLKLFEKGIPLERDRDVDVMKGIQVSEIMVQSPEVVPAETSLSALTGLFMQTHHHGFPVTDANNHLLGVVTMQDLERAATQAESEMAASEGAASETVASETVASPPLTAADMMTRDVITIYPDEPLSKALRLMGERDFGRLPVVDRQDPKRLVGLLRRGDMVRAYRHAILRKLEHQQRREGLRLGRLTDMEILELTLPSDKNQAPRTIADLRLPPQTLITSIRRRGKVIIAHGETTLEAGDHLVVLAQQGTAEAVRRALLDKG